MKNISGKTLFAFGAIVLFSTMAFSQSLKFNSRYDFEPAVIDAPPENLNFPDVDYPDSARKNGVEGTVGASLTLGEDGRTRDIQIIKTLSPDVDQAVRQALQKVYFKPASFQGKPVPIKMTYYLSVTAVYSEFDKNVGKPKFLSPPAPVFPEKYRGEKWKEKVLVKALFKPDGTIKVIGTSSVMPREFDEAAVEAVEKLKFEPAIHKKSKKQVAVEMTIEVKFQS